MVGLATLLTRNGCNLNKIRVYNFNDKCSAKKIYTVVFCFRISQDIFWKNYHNGLTLEETVEQLHCANCNR